LAPFPALAGIDLAAHLVGVRVRLFLARETDEPHGAGRLQSPHQPRHFNQHCDGRRIVVCAGRRRNRVVMRADNDDLVLPSASGQFRHNVGNFLTADRVGLPLNGITRVG
jgi:hypothetical protein